MCATSAISDYYMQPRFPQQPMTPAMPMPGLGGYSPTIQQIVQHDPETKEMLRKVIMLLDKLDKRLGDVECMDEKKAAFFKALDLDSDGRLSNGS